MPRMALMIVGLVLFLGAHSIRIFADRQRTALRERLGEGPWKGAYSLVSILGLVLVGWRYPATRDSAVLFWPPLFTRHIAWLLTLFAFVLLAAAYVPGTYIKAAVKHPMVAAVKTWALAHLIANGRLGDAILFGAFLVWAILDFRSARQRDRAANTTYAAKGVSRDAIAIMVGAAAWFVFAKWLHLVLIGVYPFV